VIVDYGLQLGNSRLILELEGMVMRNFLMIVASLILVGCGTEYQADGLTGGYTDSMTGYNTAVVQFKGNGYTSATEANKFAFRRAAELTLEKGYDYFLVENGNDRMKTETTSTNYNCNSYGYGNSSNTNCYAIGGIDIEKPRTMLQIRMFKGKTPNTSGYYDARFLAGS